MSGWLLDTNILSEIRKGQRCNAGVRQWFASADEDDLFISVIVLGEIRQGIERIRLRDSAQAASLEKWLSSISIGFAERILPVSEEAADQWGRLGSRQPVPVLDGLLAATALVHDLTMVSRDENGFRGTGVSILNPFSKSK
jgi:hypothetical protein